MRPVYEKIVEDELNIPDEFLKNHEATIKKRFIVAGGSETSQSYFDSPDLFGLNQCIHLANSIVLLGSKGEKSIKSASNVIKNNIDNKCHDITPILTIATLYYIIRRMEAKMEEKEVLRKIRSRFDKANWLIGTDLMQFLGIETLADQP